MQPEDQCRRLIEILRRKGIDDERVLAAVENTPRELFVPAASREAAYDDRALAIGGGQTISQPYMVALMTQELALAGEELVLEIGTGSGYQTAVLAQLCRRVVTIERMPELASRARHVLAAQGFENIEFHIGDGTHGWAGAAPYDAIIVTAAAPAIPGELYAQLVLGGRLVIPVGTAAVQTLQVITRGADEAQIEDVCECCFVKLIGDEGWAAS